MSDTEDKVNSHIIVGTRKFILNEDLMHGRKGNGGKQQTSMNLGYF